MADIPGGFSLPDNSNFPMPMPSSASPAANSPAPGLPMPIAPEKQSGSKWPSHTDDNPLSSDSNTTQGYNQENVLPADQMQNEENADRFGRVRQVAHNTPNIPAGDEHVPGISEAGDAKSDRKANARDGIRIVKGGVEVAAIVLSGGAAAGAAGAGAAGSTAAAGGAAAGEAAAAGTAEAASAAGATGAGAGAASEAAGASAVESGAAATENAAISTPDPNQVGDALNSSKLDSLNDASDRISMAKKAMEGLNQTDPKRRKFNRDIAREKQNQDWSQDHRGRFEKGLDKQQSRTGIDAVDAIDKVPVLGDILASGARIKMRTDRQRIKRRQAFLNNLVIIGGAALLLMMPLLTSATAGAVSSAEQEKPPAESCNIGDVDPTNIKDTDSVGPYKGDQLRNAAYIMNAALPLGLDRSAQLLGVMTAMGESSLVNIDYGDWETNGVRNPDGSPTTSIGLFQQQTSWGSIQDRMDPTKSATLFYKRLIKIADWKSLEPTIAIHKVQINSDPYHYRKYEANAQKIVDFISGVPGGVGAPSGECAAVATGEWVLPWAPDAPNQEIRDGYGWRPRHPITGKRTWHNGYDFGFGKHGDDVLAIGAGTVIKSWDSGSCQFQVIIEHGDKSRSQYIHLFRSYVHAGQTVTAGERIGAQGGSPKYDPRAASCSTGTHLHLETWENGISVNPGLYLKARGIDLSSWKGWDPDPVDYNGR